MNSFFRTDISPGHLTSWAARPFMMTSHWMCTVPELIVVRYTRYFGSLTTGSLF